MVRFHLRVARRGGLVGTGCPARRSPDSQRSALLSFLLLASLTTLLLAQKDRGRRQDQFICLASGAHTRSQRIMDLDAALAKSFRKNPYSALIDGGTFNNDKSASTQEWVKALQEKYPNDGWRLSPWGLGFPVSDKDAIRITQNPLDPKALPPHTEGP